MMKNHVFRIWRTNCQCLAEYDEVIVAKDLEIKELKRQLRFQTVASDPLSAETRLVDSPEAQGRGETRRRVEPV